MCGRQVNPQRIAAVRHALSLRWTDAEIVRLVSKEFVVSDATIRADLKRCYAELAAYCAVGREKKIQRAVATATALLREALNGGNRSVAQRYARELNKIEGVYAPTQVEVDMPASTTNVEVFNVSTLTTEELERLAAARETAIEIMERASARSDPKPARATKAVDS